MDKSTKEEYEKCVKDPVYFMTHYCGCVCNESGDVIMPINLTKEQVEDIRDGKVRNGVDKP